MTGGSADPFLGSAAFEVELTEIQRDKPRTQECRPRATSPVPAGNLIDTVNFFATKRIY